MCFESIYIFTLSGFVFIVDHCKAGQSTHPLKAFFTSWHHCLIRTASWQLYQRLGKWTHFPDIGHTRSEWMKDRDYKRSVGQCHTKTAIWNPKKPYCSYWQAIFCDCCQAANIKTLCFSCWVSWVLAATGTAPGFQRNRAEITDTDLAKEPSQSGNTPLFWINIPK